MTRAEGAVRGGKEVSLGRDGRKRGWGRGIHAHLQPGGPLSGTTVCRGGGTGVDEGPACQEKGTKWNGCLSTECVLFSCYPSKISKATGKSAAFFLP